MEKEPLPVSGIQHFAFCRRQWALICIENQWNENGLTAEGRFQHTRVHDSHIVDYRNGNVILRDMRIGSEKLGLTGACDVLELIPDPEGIGISGHEGLWRLRPVEYKHGQPKDIDCDRLQVTAQAMCLEEMLCCTIPEVALFYEKTRHRENVAVTEELREQVRRMAAEMHELFDHGHTPAVKPGKKCNNCSLKDICLPDILKHTGKTSVRDYIDKHLTEVDVY